MVVGRWVDRLVGFWILGLRRGKGKDSERQKGEAKERNGR